MKRLTHPQQRFLVALYSFEHSPTIREIRDRLGFKSDNSVAQKIDATIEKGYLKRLGHNKARSTVVTEKGVEHINSLGVCTPEQARWWLQYNEE